MVLARVRSAAVLGIDAYVVEVETDIVRGLPSFATVGLPHGAVKEGRERVNAAITNSGFEFPLKRITGLDISLLGCLPRQSRGRFLGSRATLRSGVQSPGSGSPHKPGQISQKSGKI